LLTVVLCLSLNDHSHAQTKAHNPIIWADVLDMSMVRVGDTYYMSSTTMHMVPGGSAAQKTTFTFTLKLPMLKPGATLSAYIYDANLKGAKGTVRVGKSNKLKVTSPCNGAVVLVS
jgi:gentisate 1,2-dioxygenase